MILCIVYYPVHSEDYADSYIDSLLNALTLQELLCLLRPLPSNRAFLGHIGSTLGGTKCIKDISSGDVGSMGSDTCVLLRWSIGEKIWLDRGTCFRKYIERPMLVRP